MAKDKNSLLARLHPHCLLGMQHRACSHWHSQAVRAVPHTSSARSQLGVLQTPAKIMAVAGLFWMAPKAVLLIQGLVQSFQAELTSLLRAAPSHRTVAVALHRSAVIETSAVLILNSIASAVVSSRTKVTATAINTLHGVSTFTVLMTYRVCSREFSTLSMAFRDLQREVSTYLGAFKTPQRRRASFLWGLGLAPLRSMTLASGQLPAAPVAMYTYLTRRCQQPTGQHLLSPGLYLIAPRLLRTALNASWTEAGATKDLAWKTALER